VIIVALIFEKHGLLVVNQCRARDYRVDEERLMRLELGTTVRPVGMVYLAPIALSGQSCGADHLSAGHNILQIQRVGPSRAKTFAVSMIKVISAEVVI